MFQQTIIVGNLGGEPEMRYLPSGAAVTNVNCAVTEKWNDQQGNRQEKTTWYRITAWRKLAETLAQYAHKGDRLMFVGKPSASAWIDRDGNARATLELTVDSFKFLGSPNRNGNGNGATQAQGEPDEPPAQTEEVPF